MFQWDFSMGVWECPGAAAGRWSRLLTEFEPRSVDLPVRAGGRGGDSLDAVSGSQAIVARSRECGDDGRRPRDRDDREARFDRGGDQFMPGVADAWSAGLGD